jgi:hypothetical protein
MQLAKRIYVIREISQDQVPHPSLVDPSLDDSTAIDWSLISTRALISLYEANKERFVGSNNKKETKYGWILPIS